MTDDEVHDFLHEGRSSMAVATIGLDGRPHVVAMWYGFLDGAPAFWTYAKSQKIVNLRRDPRVTCLVESGDRYDNLRGVELVGHAEVYDDQESVIAVGKSVNERYSGPVEPTALEVIRAMSAKRAAVRVVADKVVSWDHSKLGGTY